MIPATHVLVLASALFFLSLTGLLIRRNVLVMLLCIELMLGSVALVFVALAEVHGGLRGQVVGLFVLAIAVAQIGIGLAMLMLLYRRRGELNPTSWERLKDW